MDPRALYLVDGSGFIFRAYYALPQTLTNPAGTPVGAVLGFTNMLAKLLADLGARRVAVVFDAARKNFRNDIYPDYKAHRPPAPEDLVPQFPLFRAAAQAFGLPAIEVEGFEADDLIAAYAAAEPGPVVIVGSDKDLYQLVSERVTLWDPIKGAEIGVAEVEAKFGVPPERVTDVQALAGDPTDNIPGVPGIGVKTAAQLIREYGSLDAVLTHAGRITQPKRRAALTENADAARMSLRLVTLDRAAPRPVELAAMPAPDLKRPELRAFLEEQGLASVLRRLGHRDLPYASQSAPAPEVAQTNYALITDWGALDAAIAAARGAGVLAVDTETTDLTPAKARLVGISLAWAPGHAAYIPIAHRAADILDGEPAPEQLPLDGVISRLAPALTDPAVLKLAHNAKYDWQMFAQCGVEAAPIGDTMLMAYALGTGRRSHALDALAREMLGVEMTPFEALTGKGAKATTFDRVPLDKAGDYACADADMTLRLAPLLTHQVVSERLTRVYEDIDRPLIPVIARMETTGVLIDRAALARASAEFGAELKTLEEQLYMLAKGPFNPASPQQVAEVLFGRLGLTPGGRTEKTKAHSTDAQTLEQLAAQGHEIAEKLLQFRALAKLKSTYADALPKAVNPATGRIHTSFSLAHTSTGRLASSDPNLQNIPVRTANGQRIRAAFTAPEGWHLLSVDYSQIELRVAAAMADCPGLKQAFAGGEDIHAATAQEVFGEVTGDARRAAKAINFGILYGQGAWGLARQLGCSHGEALALIGRHAARFPELGAFMEAQRALAAERGYVQTAFGRRCPVAGAKDRSPARRAAAGRTAGNAPLQGTAADIMKIAMRQMDRALAESGLRARMLLQVHDELVFEAPAEEVQDLKTLAVGVMEGAADIGVPLVAEAKNGKAWGVWED
jgi:DNA polymerase-1